MNEFEYDAIGTEAYRHGLDPDLPRAVRVAENGWGDAPAGKYYMGVIDPQGRTLAPADAIREACASLRDIIAKMRLAGVQLTELGDGQIYQGGERYRRFVISEAAFAFIQGEWAPLEALNDPHGLNAHWLADVSDAYRKLVQGGFAAWARGGTTA